MTMLSVEDLDTVFEDVTPVPQDDGPNPVCAIDYKPEFIQAYDYMRAILQADERSERALQLTALCVKLNPANYTVWHFRRQCLEKLGCDADALEQDLQLAAKLGGANPKNYQIWYHRRALLEATGMPVERAKMELNYVNGVLKEDGKNYHAWSHRQWILRTVDDAGLWQDELGFTHSLILEDPRNNSAWNQRWFVAHRGNLQAALTLEAARKEADYALSGARLDPYNESPWRFLIAVLKEQRSLVQEYEGKALELKSVLEEAGRDPDDCANMSSARIDMLEFQGDAKSLQTAIGLAKGLASYHDVIRRKYWLLRVAEMESAMS